MTIHLSFPGGSVAKNQLANQKTQVQSLSREDPLEEEMASHSSSCWAMQWTEESEGLQPMGSQESRHNFATKQRVSRQR